MTAMILIYGAVALFAVTAVALAVFNLVSLSRVTTSIHLLEQNIEKKALEFDAIRKEQLASQSNPTNSFEDTITESVVPSNLSGGNADAPQIQIFRNVRKSHFEEPDGSQNAAPTATSSYNQPDPRSQQYPPQSSLSDYDTNTNQDNTVMTDGDVMAVVNEEQTSGFAKTGEQLTISVFSPMIRGADYTIVSQQLQSLPQMAPPPVIILDFSNITRILNTEITYLQQVEAYVRNNGGNMFLYNCQGEVFAILQRDPVLAPLVKV